MLETSLFFLSIFMGHDFLFASDIHFSEYIEISHQTISIALRMRYGKHHIQKENARVEQER